VAYYKEAGMAAPLAQTPPELVFAAQAPFSWTRRWALAHRTESQIPNPSYRIDGSARSANELSEAVSFARDHAAQLQLNWGRAA
jgi:hypothetical protein